jgi:hypothetical protein
MSLKVLVIPEDFRKDQYMLRPLIRAMFEFVNKPNAKIEICTDPLLGGVTEVLKWNRIDEVIEMYPMIDIFLVCIDRDGLSGRRDSMNSIENLAQAKLGNTKRVLFAENAWQEIETWILGGLDLPSEWSWSDIRNEVQVKEKYFIPLSESRGLLDSPAEGRGVLAEEAAGKYKSIRSQKCGELGHIDSRIQAWL